MDICSFLFSFDSSNNLEIAKTLYILILESFKTSSFFLASSNFLLLTRFKIITYSCVYFFALISKMIFLITTKKINIRIKENIIININLYFLKKFVNLSCFKSSSISLKS